MTAVDVERARALVGLNRWSDATEALRPALGDPAAGADPWCLQARCDLGLGRPREALDAASRAVAIDPEAEWGHRLVAVASLQLGDRAAALRACRAALQLEPDQCEGLHLLSAVHLARRSGVAEAEQAADRNLRINPDRALAWESAANVALTRKDWSRAEECARRGLAIDPQDSDLAMILGTALERQGRSTEAGNAYAAAARADPTDHRARSAIGRLGLPIAGGALLVIKVFAVLGIRGVSLWADAPPLLLAVILTAGTAAAWAAVEGWAWRARRELSPALRAVALRERKVAARTWLAAVALVDTILAIRAFAAGEPIPGVLLGLVVVALLVARGRLPRPATRRPERWATAVQSIRRRFRWASNSS